MSLELVIIQDSECRAGKGRFEWSVEKWGPETGDLGIRDRRVRGFEQSISGDRGDFASISTSCSPCKTRRPHCVSADTRSRRRVRVEPALIPDSVGYGHGPFAMQPPGVSKPSSESSPGETSEGLNTVATCKDEAITGSERSAIESSTGGEFRFEPIITIPSLHNGSSTGDAHAQTKGKSLFLFSSLCPSP